MEINVATGKWNVAAKLVVTDNAISSSSSSYSSKVWQMKVSRSPVSEIFNLKNN